MGALFSSPSPPTPPPVPVVPPAANPPIMANSQVAQSGASQRSRAAAAAGAGFDGTVTNAAGSGGLQAPATAQTTLLGG